MHAEDIALLHTLVLAHGIDEVLSGLGKVCSDRALEIAPTNAHLGNIFMAISCELDRMVVEYEGETTNPG